MGEDQNLGDHSQSLVSKKTVVDMKNTNWYITTVIFLHCHEGFFFFLKEHPCIKPFDQISQCSTYANKSLFSFSLSKQARVFLTQHTARTPLVLTVPCPLTRYGNLVQSVHFQRWNRTPCPVSMFCYGAGVHTTVQSSPLRPRKKVETGCHLLSDPGRRLRLAAIQPSCLKSSSVCLWLLLTDSPFPAGW